MTLQQNQSPIREDIEETKGETLQYDNKIKRVINQTKAKELTV